MQQCLLSFECDDACDSVFNAHKARFALLKQQTIPHLKLLTVLLLSKLMISITQTLKTRFQLHPPQYYSDVQVVVCWIKRV